MAIFPLIPPADAPGDAVDNQPLRSALLTLVQPLLNPNVVPGNDATVQVLGDLAASFSRFAGNQKTAFDDSASTASTNGGANVLQSQVRRAWTQVLGRAPGSGVSFVQALNGAFPAASDGSGVLTVPARSVVSMYSPDGLGTTMAGITGNGGGQLSVGQATLFRQASVIASDAQKVLAGLTTTSPEADFEQMEALRTLISTQITNLVQEFGRVDEPRSARVTTYLTALQGVPGVPGTLGQFGIAAVYNNNPAWVTTDNDAAQLAGFALLQRYVTNLSAAWTAYSPPGAGNQFDPSDPNQLSLRLERANMLLPSVGQANSYVRQALSSVGFSESEQRSIANRFSRLGPPAGDDPATNPPTPGLAIMTPGDLADWIESFNDDGLSTLAGSGSYGLQFVTNQADSIFWVVGAVLYAVLSPVNVQQPSLLEYLDNERVRWSLANLLTQLDGLADLAIPLPLLN